jgi:hypothetical protein
MPAPILETSAADRRHNLRMPVEFLEQTGRLVTRHGTFVVRLFDVSAGGYGVELSGNAPAFKFPDADLELDGERVPVTICHVKQESGQAFLGLQRRDWSPSDELIAIQRARMFQQHRHLLLRHYLSDRRVVPSILAVLATAIVLLYASGVWRPRYERGWSYQAGGTSARSPRVRESIAAESSRGATPSEHLTRQLTEAAKSTSTSESRGVRRTLVKLEQLASSTQSSLALSAAAPILVTPDAASSLKSFLASHKQTIPEEALTDGLQRLTSRSVAALNGQPQTGRLDLGDETTLRIRWSRTSDGIVIDDVTESARSGD